MNPPHGRTVIRIFTFALCLTVTMLLHQDAAASADGPRVIKEDATCAKCGMYPAKYPEWQTQIIFADGTMKAFDGNKCMFGFMNHMSKFDTAHSRDDIKKIWVKDFNSGEWMDATAAHYVVGSKVMGPMGKELIPFKDKAAATAFQKENGGELLGYGAISMETLKPLMGKMHMKGKMKMDGKMDMQGHIQK